MTICTCVRDQDDVIFLTDRQHVSRAKCIPRFAYRTNNGEFFRCVPFYFRKIDDLVIRAVHRWPDKGIKSRADTYIAVLTFLFDLSYMRQQDPCDRNEVPSRLKP